MLGRPVVSSRSIVSPTGTFRSLFTRSAKHQLQDDIIKHVTPNCAHRVRNELHWRMMGLTEGKPQKFATSSWLKTQYPYLVYRIICFAHAVSILTYKAYAESIKEDPPSIAWIEALPTWSFIIYTAYHTIALVFTALQFFHDCLCNDDLAWYHKISWVMQTVAFNGSFVCFVGSLGYIASTSAGNDSAQEWFAVYRSDDVNFYAIVGIVMIVDIFLTNVSVRLLHFIYADFFILVFYSFHIYRWASGFTPGLVALDYGGRLDIAVPHLFVTVLVMVPFTHVIAYGMDTLRWRLMISCVTRHRRRIIDLVNAAEGFEVYGTATPNKRQSATAQSSNAYAATTRPATSVL